ncbi:MAG: OmpA family protein [Alphaproteobacteria bacterium]|nr:OmpA family protein [Alphaproteobacteria bacterium]
MKHAVFLIISLSVFLTLPSVSFAQEGSYSPPPLFGEPKLPPPKAEKTQRDLKLPSISKEVDNPEIETDIPEKGLPALHSPAVDSSPEKPVEPQEIQKTQKKADPKDISVKPEPKPSPPIPKKEIKPGAEPIELLEKKEEKPAPKSSSGVIKGPKSMPATKKQSVEAQPTFEDVKEPQATQKPDKAPIADMLLRAQPKEEIKPENKKSPTDEAKALIRQMEVKESPPPTKIMQDGTQKIILPFTDRQATLDDNGRAIIDQMILPKLDENIDNTILIQSYASKLEGVMNSDRRLALSRAMAVREYLIEQTIQPHRITVRASGEEQNSSQSSTQGTAPIERVELYLKIHN